MLPCPTCQRLRVTIHRPATARCGADLSDVLEQESRAAPPVTPIHIEPHRRLITPLALFSVALLVGGAFLAGTASQETIGWLLVAIGVTCLVFSVVHHRPG